MIDAAQQERIEQLQRLEQDHKVKATQLEEVRYQLFTEIPDIGGHQAYPPSKLSRDAILCHEERVQALRRREATLTRDLAVLGERIRAVRDSVVINAAK